MIDVSFIIYYTFFENNVSIYKKNFYILNSCNVYQYIINFYFNQWYPRYIVLIIDDLILKSSIYI